MRSLRVSLAVLFIAISTNQARPIQIGPEIRIGGGEATIGGLGIKNGKVVTPTPDQLLDSAINTTPLMVLSDADKKNVKQAIVTTGVIATVVSNPVLGLVVISVLNGTGQKTDVPVPVTEAPPTGTTLDFTAKCLVQQEGGLITALFTDDPPRLADLKAGDTLNLHAPFCPEYPKNSVTNVTVKFTGKSDYPTATPPQYRHYVVGRSA